LFVFVELLPCEELLCLAETLGGPWSLRQIALRLNVFNKIYENDENQVQRSPCSLANGLFSIQPRTSIPKLVLRHRYHCWSLRAWQRQPIL